MTRLRDRQRTRWIKFLKSRGFKHEGNGTYGKRGPHGGGIWFVPRKKIPNNSSLGRLCHWLAKNACRPAS